MEYTENAPLPQNGQGLMKQQPPFGLLDLAVIVFGFLFTYGLLHSILERLEPDGYTTVCYLGLFTLATILICKKQGRFAPKALLPGFGCIAMSLSFLLHGDNDLHIILFLLLIPLSGFYCLTLTGANVHAFGSFYVWLDLLRCEVLLPFKHLPAPFLAAAAALKRRRDAKDKTKRRKGWIPVGIGVLAAVPILLLVIPLLLDADAAFESVAGEAFHALQQGWENVASFLEDHFSFNAFALYLSLFAFVYIFSVMFSFANGIAKEDNKDTSAKLRKLQKAPVAFFAAMLGVVCAVYVIYLLSQFAYFFSAFSGKLPSGAEITVTEYARRGFFEMVKIAAVNFLLIASSVGLCKRRGTRLAPVIRWLNVFLCAFTILLCVISVCKIWMYIRPFGLTQKRLYVFTADLALICCFAAVLLRLFKERFPYMKGMLCAVFFSAAALGLIGVDNTVAYYNTNGLLAGRLQSYQVEELQEECGDAALPYLQKIAAGESDYAKKAALILDGFDIYASRQSEPFQNLEQARVVRYISKEILHDSENFFLEVQISTLTDVYGLGYEVLLDGKSIFSGGLQSADGSPLKPEQVIAVSKADLPQDADLSKLDFRFSIYLAPGDDCMETPVKNSSEPLTENVKFGGAYPLSIVETDDGEFEIW